MMRASDDKESARIRFDGEAERVRIGRPRLDRDGLRLFGRRLAAQTVTLSAAELAALFEGRTIAVDVGGVYIVYLNVDAGALDAVRLIGAVTGAPRFGCGDVGAGSSIPQREDPGARPTYEERVLAARIRVKIDRQQWWPRRVKTPEWIVQLAKGDISR
jgi:hypothetical protein